MGLEGVLPWAQIWVEQVGTGSDGVRWDGAGWDGGWRDGMDGMGGVCESVSSHVSWLRASSHRGWMEWNEMDGGGKECARMGWTGMACDDM